MNSRLSKEEQLDEGGSVIWTVLIVLGFIGIGICLLVMLTSDPQTNALVHLITK